MSQRLTLLGAKLHEFWAPKKCDNAKLGFSFAIVLFTALLLTHHMIHPRSFSTAVFIQNANESVAIGFMAMAQTIPVLMGGLDLSVGAVMTLANCIASDLVNGSPAHMIFGMIVTLACGTAFGFINGMIVVYGRIQPIIATLATGVTAIGLALIVRPSPGATWMVICTGRLPMRYLILDRPTGSQMTATRRGCNRLQIFQCRLFCYSVPRSWSRSRLSSL